MCVHVLVGSLPTYESNKVLGKLFRTTKAKIAADSDSNQEIASQWNLLETLVGGTKCKKIRMYLSTPAAQAHVWSKYKHKMTLWFCQSA